MIDKEMLMGDGHRRVRNIIVGTALGIAVVAASSACQSSSSGGSTPASQLNPVSATTIAPSATTPSTAPPTTKVKTKAPSGGGVSY